jgi:ABC-type Fe3+/spermidine/putrescine transport system ATPase subunit
MTVAENVAYPLRMRRLPRSARHTRVAEYLQLVELEHEANRFPDELSGGQQQRVALARALVSGPRVLLMDEPLGSLDRRLRQSLQFEIKRLHEELSATMIYVTHDQEEALAMSDRVAVMRGGTIEQLDKPQTVYESPATPFVATFLGETNMLAVVVQGGSRDGCRVFHPASGQEVFLDVGADVGPKVLSVRPESIRLANVEANEGFLGAVVSRTFMGDCWRYECAVGSDIVVVRTPVHDGRPASVGAAARVAPIPGTLRLFTAHPDEPVAAEGDPT